MEPAQRCVPGPGAWVDCGECFFSFREVEVEFFFFFQGRESGREPPIDVFRRGLFTRFLPLLRLELCLDESNHHEGSQRPLTSGKRTSPGEAREGMKRLIPSRMRKGRGAKSRRKIEKCGAASDAEVFFFFKTRKKKQKTFCLLIRLQSLLLFRNFNHALHLQVGLASGQG